MWRGQGQEANRGEAGGHRIMRHGKAMRSLLLPCAATEVSLRAVWCLSGATPRGPLWTPAVTLPHGYDKRRAQRMAVVWAFREPSRCRHVRRACLRHTWRDFAPRLPANACHPRQGVE